MAKYLAKTSYLRLGGNNYSTSCGKVEKLKLAGKQVFLKVLICRIIYDFSATNCSKKKLKSVMMITRNRI